MFAALLLPWSRPWQGGEAQVAGDAYAACAGDAGAEGQDRQVAPVSGSSRKE